jgi:hypothetical protein
MLPVITAETIVEKNEARCVEPSHQHSQSRGPNLDQNDANCNAHYKGVKSEFEHKILNLDSSEAASDFEPA